MSRWAVSNIPDQSGRCAVVTGTGGLGFEDALALARAGAEVVLLGRNTEKGVTAVARIRAAVPAASIRFEAVDLASLDSIARLGKRLRNQRGSIDLLVNNAGVMTPPRRMETEDGFELQFGTNYLGHFALTAHLMPLLCNGRDRRVVTVSSIAARQGAIDFDDLGVRRNYRPMHAYAQSKLACLMFALELERRSVAAGWGVASYGAHPGLSRTDLLYNAPGGSRWSLNAILRLTLRFTFQPAAQGALPTLFAATEPAARPGAYYGPDGMAELRGHPAEAKIPARALDAAACIRLWDLSEELVGVSF